MAGPNRNKILNDMQEATAEHFCRPAISQSLLFFSRQLIKRVNALPLSSAVKETLAQEVRLALKQEMTGIFDQMARSTTACNKQVIEIFDREFRRMMPELYRKNHLGRIFVHFTIEPWFPRNAEEVQHVREKFVSRLIAREIIPGLIAALENVFGSAFINVKRQEAESIVGTHRLDKESRIDFEQVFADPRAVALARQMAKDLKDRFDAGYRRAFMNSVKNVTEASRPTMRLLCEPDFLQIEEAMFSLLDRSDIGADIHGSPNPSLDPAATRCRV